MDEQLDYSGEQQMQRVSSAWHGARSAGSAESIARDPSKLYLQYKNFHLHLVQQVDYPSTRPVIPSTKAERYSYYRLYTTSPNKCQLICLPMGDFNTMIWKYLFNGFFKTLPHMYTNLFLASYSPEEHLFLPKMVPFFYGAKFAFLATSLFDLAVCFHHVILVFGYMIQGMAFKNPWNRCDILNMMEPNRTATCLTRPQFTERITNMTWTAKNSSYYLLADGSAIQLSQITYYRKYFGIVTHGPFRVLYFLMAWLVILLSHKLVYKKLFWKIIRRVQLIQIFVEVSLFLYLLNVKEQEVHIPELTLHDSESEAIMAADIDFMAESVVAPPVLHVLTARSSQDINPSSDSFLIYLSNGCSYLFRGILMNRLRIHCMSSVGAPLHYPQFRLHTWFIFWTLFFSEFYWGDLYTIAFLFLNGFADLLALLVTYHCFVEVAVCEWKFMKEWMVNLGITVAFIPVYIYTTFKERVYHHVYTKLLASFFEIVAIYYLYPEGRLIDDVTFHFGAAPTTLYTLLHRFMPLLYVTKLYMMIKYLGILRKLKQLMKIDNWLLMAGPWAVGIIYITYKYLIKDKRSWQRMFIPDCDWGPQDHVIRQLRKEFDSRTYIGSQAQRHLSRYMIVKLESNAFHLDLNYNPNRRSTMAASKYRMDTEKKDT